MGGTRIQTPARAAGRVQERLWLRYLPEGEATCVWGLMWCCPGFWWRKTRGSSIHVQWTARWKRDLSQRNSGQGAGFQPDRLLLPRLPVPRTRAVSPRASGAESAIAPSVCISSKNPLAFVVLSFKQQTVVSFCFAVRGGREPLLSQA